MKKILIIFFLFMPVCSYATNWVLVAYNDKNKWYVDTDTVERQKSIVNYWMITDYPEKQKQLDFVSIKSKEEMNCSTKEVTSTYVILYPEHEGKGDVLLSYKPDRNTTPVVPDSAIDILMRFVCRKK